MEPISENTILEKFFSMEKRFAQGNYIVNRNNIEVSAIDDASRSPINRSHRNRSIYYWIRSNMDLFGGD